jgi:hypothetical protein
MYMDILKSDFLYSVSIFERDPDDQLWIQIFLITAKPPCLQLFLKSLGNPYGCKDFYSS